MNKVGDRTSGFSVYVPLPPPMNNFSLPKLKSIAKRSYRPGTGTEEWIYVAHDKQFYNLAAF